MTAETKDFEIRAGLADISSFDVVGISIITDNQKGAEDINGLWERFFAEQIGQKVANKENDIIYAVYSDYQGDHEAPYRLTIGYRVTEDGVIDKDMNRVAIQDQSYAVMSAAGPQPQTLVETWRAIWSSDLERSYATDFEVYGPRFFEDGINEVLIHIGVNV